MIEYQLVETLGKKPWILSRFLWSCFGLLSGLFATTIIALRLGCLRLGCTRLGPSPGTLPLRSASFQIPAGKLDMVHAVHADWSHAWLACWPESWPEQPGC